MLAGSCCCLLVVGVVRMHRSRRLPGGRPAYAGFVPAWRGVARERGRPGQETNDREWPESSRPCDDAMQLGASSSKAARSSSSLCPAAGGVAGLVPLHLHACRSRPVSWSLVRGAWP